MRGLFAIILAIFFLSSHQANAATRIKDVVYFEGVRENLLVGYGLVVGLNNSGDNLKNSSFTEKGLSDFLSRLGVNTRGTDLKTKNVAAVTVTATLPPFGRQGSRIDISVSTLGDAKSLEGGTLLATPLLGADGEVYAVAQGPIAVGGFSASGQSGSSVTKNIPTSGNIASGGVIEREIEFNLNAMEKVKLALRNPDLTTALTIAERINEVLGEDAASASDPGTVSLRVPDLYHSNVVTLLADIEQLPIEPDMTAKIAIDEATGTVVMGENVRISTVAVAHGNLVVRVTETPLISQPGAFAPESATTQQATLSRVDVEEEKNRKLAVVRTGASLAELVNGLNALGVGPRDLISILQTIKASGSLQADIVTR